MKLPSAPSPASATTAQATGAAAPAAPPAAARGHFDHALRRAEAERAPRRRADDSHEGSTDGAAPAAGLAAAAARAAAEAPPGAAPEATADVVATTPAAWSLPPPQSLLARADAAPVPVPPSATTDTWMQALRQLHAPAGPEGLQHWHFAFADGHGPLQSLTLQAQPGAPWQLALRSSAVAHSVPTAAEREALAARLAQLQDRLARRGATVGRITLDDDT